MLEWPRKTQTVNIREFCQSEGQCAPNPRGHHKMRMAGLSIDANMDNILTYDFDKSVLKVCIKWAQSLS